MVISIGLADVVKLGTRSGVFGHLLGRCPVRTASRMAREPIQSQVHRSWLLRPLDGWVHAQSTSGGRKWDCAYVYHTIRDGNRWSGRLSWLSQMHTGVKMVRF